VSHLGLSFVYLIQEAANVSQVGLRLYQKDTAPKVSQHGILPADAGPRHSAELAHLVTLHPEKL
jgi:hypothetical protein